MEHQPPHIKDWSQLFANHRGQWVALADDEVTVLAAAPTAKAALAASASKGSPKPILYRVPDTLDTFSFVRFERPRGTIELGDIL
jgi:hypothetical protein